jgi:endonuclease/exonuclease/phosphatase family metal-dependent hydrolase
MRNILVLLVAAAAAFACGSSSSPTAPGSSVNGAVEFRVMTFNVQHGIDNAGKYGLDAAVRTIAAVNPDLVGLQELTRNHPAYKCEDQPAQLARDLTAQTGRTWNHLYHQEWTTTVHDCKGDTPETEGIGFLAPTPVSEDKSVQLWNGRLGLMTTLRGGRGLPVIVTHLGSGTAGQSDRLRQLDTLLPWTQSQGAWRVFLGDFNAGPNSEEYQRITAVYRDAWADAVASGKAKGLMSGITHKSSRIDYIFYVPGDAVELVSVETVDTAMLLGSDPSDHRPVVATFRVK